MQFIGIHNAEFNWQCSLSLLRLTFCRNQRHIFLKASYSLSAWMWKFQALLILTDHEIMIYNTIKSQGLLSCHKEMHWLQQTSNGYADLISSFEFEIFFDWSTGPSGNEKSKPKTKNPKKS